MYFHRKIHSYISQLTYFCVINLIYCIFAINLVLIFFSVLSIAMGVGIMIETDIKQQLISAAIGTDSTIVVGSVPTSPGDIIVIGSSEGVLTALENATLSSQNVMVQKAVSLPNMPDVRQTLSIIVINADYTAAHDKIWDVYNELIGQESGFKVCYGRQMYFVPIQSPYFYKTDAGKTYFIFNVNVNATREP